MVITGTSGGEFGVVGSVEARDVNTGELVWTRPVIEGHVGTLNGQPNGMTGKLNASWTGDTYKTGGGATWLGGTYDPGTNLVYFGTDTHCHLALKDGTEVVARLQSPATGDAGLTKGQTVGLRFAPGAAQVVED